MQVKRGVLLFSAIVVAGCATTPMQPPAVNVTGQWSGTWAYERQSLGSGSLRGTLTQNGERLSGSFSLAGGGGRLSGPRVVTVIGTVSGNEITLSQPSLGTLTVTGNEISGVVRGLDDARVILQKQ